LVYSVFSELIAPTLDIFFFNRRRPVLYLVFNKMVYSVLTQLHKLGIFHSPTNALLLI